MNDLIKGVKYYTEVCRLVYMTMSEDEKTTTGILGVFVIFLIWTLI